MREILYRGIRVDNGKWVYGFYVREYSHVIKELPSIATPQIHIVLPETVGQFTGLTDKNDKKIFEGDIVSFAERRIGGEDASIVEQVKFEEGGFCTNRYFLNNWMRSGNTKLDGIEVIGNIHDNPELLEDAE